MSSLQHSGSKLRHDDDPETDLGVSMCQGLFLVLLLNAIDTSGIHVGPQMVGFPWFPVNLGRYFKPRDPAFKPAACCMIACDKASIWTSSRPTAKGFRLTMPMPDSLCRRSRRRIRRSKASTAWWGGPKITRGLCPVRYQLEQRLRSRFYTGSYSTSFSGAQENLTVCYAEWYP